MTIQEIELEITRWRIDVLSCRIALALANDDVYLASSLADSVLRHVDFLGKT